MKTTENIVDGVELPRFQSLGVEQALLNHKMLLAFDTGTGKTITYSVFVRGLLNRDPDKKHIFVIIHDSLTQAPTDIRNITSVSVGAYSSEREEYIRLKREWDQHSIFVLTYECFRQMDIVGFLYNHLPEIESFVIDEAHHASNWDSSDTAFMIRALSHRLPYVIGLSATPITSKKSQYFQLMNTLDRDLSSRRGETAANKYTARYLPVNRADYHIKGNYRTTLELVTPSMHQIGEIRGIVSRVIKGSGAVNQVEKLVSVVRSRLSDNKTIIVYVNYHDTREWVEEHFREASIPYTTLHGRIVKQADKEASLDRFRTGEVSVLITSVAESLNIESDVVVFYEYTTKLKQVMGRAHRGLTGKELELVFIITRDSAEVDYFLKYIYSRSLVIQKLLGKDYSELIKIGESIQNMSLSSS